MYSYICVVRYIYLSFLMEPLLCSETGALQSQKTFVFTWLLTVSGAMTLHDYPFKNNNKRNKQINKNYMKNKGFVLFHLQATRLVLGV